MQRLQSYRWPGNIRELENVIERAVILADNPIIQIDPEMLASRSDSTAQAETPNNASFEAISRQHILSVLEQTRWIIEGASGAANILNMQPSTLRYRMKKLGIVKPSH